MNWHGGRNSVQGWTGEWEPSSGFTYLTFLSHFPGLFRGSHRVWAHEHGQPVQVAARLKITELNDWGRRRVRRREASCVLVVDGVETLLVMPARPVTSCAQAKRLAAAHLGNDDWVRRGLQWFYGGSDARGTRRVGVLQDGAPYATLFTRSADWLLAPGSYQITTAAGCFELRRDTTSVECWSSAAPPHVASRS